jgi:hypothetical protein
MYARAGDAQSNHDELRDVFLMVPDNPWQYVLPVSGAQHGQRVCL